MKRREFLKSAAAGTAITMSAGGIGPFVRRAHAEQKKEDIGSCKSLKVTVVSETAWFDSARMLKDIQDTGGAMVSSYVHPWTQENLGGYSALLEVEQLDGSKHTILMDTNWRQDWCDHVFQKAGVDKLLENKKIDIMVITHEHHDHYWGIKSTLKRWQTIPLVIPNTFYPEGKALLAGKYKNDVAQVENDIPHTGPLEVLGPDRLLKLYPGVAVKMFDIPIMNRVRGEQNFYFNIKDKGIVSVSGCCHAGIINLMMWANRNIEGAKPYACYGGLHIAAFENWDPKFDDIIQGVKRMGLQKLACNHCTGWVWATKARSEGLPIVLGTQKYKEYRKTPTTGPGAAENVYLRNGDTIVFA
jgi:7,8-dihydropterin-6-yl-methyl-4-(beta-D-ribofuranosyl)aminobenzene 5'-phosphate synthase